MTSEYEGMTAFLYARVSTDNKGQDTATQIRNMRGWCSKNGVTILKTFTEEKSAKDTDRPVFNQLIGEIQTRNMKALAYLPDGRVDPKTVHVNIVLAWQESRISRNEDDMTDILAILKTWGVVLRYVASSAKPEERGGRLLHNISTWEGETENQLKSLNTKQGMSNASLKGIYCGRRYAFVFREDMEGLYNSDPKKSRVQLEQHLGKNGNVVYTRNHSVEDVMHYASLGYTRGKTAKVLGVNRMTLARRLKEKGLLEEYDRISSEARKTGTQGSTNTRVGNGDENRNTREGEE